MKLHLEVEKDKIIKKLNKQNLDSKISQFYLAMVDEFFIKNEQVATVNNIELLTTKHIQLSDLADMFNLDSKIIDDYLHELTEAELLASLKMGESSRMIIFRCL